MSEHLEEDQTKAEQEHHDRPAVGPDPNFSQKVLQSFKERPLTESEIETKQKNWQRYTKERPEVPKVNDFPKYFYAGFWVRLGAFLIDLLCIGSITRLTLGIALNLGWIDYADSYLSFYGGAALVFNIHDNPPRNQSIFVISTSGINSSINAFVAKSSENAVALPHATPHLNASTGS